MKTYDKTNYTERFVICCSVLLLIKLQLITLITEIYMNVKVTNVIFGHQKGQFQPW